MAMETSAEKPSGLPNIDSDYIFTQTVINWE